MKRLIPLLLFLAAGVFAAEPVHVVVVGTTDVHGWFDGHRDANPPYGGLPLFASYVEALRAANPGHVLVVDSGDVFQGTLESNYFEGKPLVDAYNAIGYSAVAVGNHEFDYGPAGREKSVPRDPGDDPLGALKERVAQAKFPFLGANITEKATGKTPAWVHRSAIVKVEGATIGIIGLTTPDTPITTMPANVAALSFNDPVKAAVSEAAALRAAGADAVIVIAHMGGRCKDLNDIHDVASCETNQEVMRFLAAIPKGTIDAYFAGHTHSQMRQVINDVPVLQALNYSREFSMLDLWVDPAAHHVTKAELRPLTMICAKVFEKTATCDPKLAPAGAPLVPRVFEGKTIAPDAKLAALLKPYEEQVAAKRMEPLGVRTTAEFAKGYSLESPLGDLLADLMREATGADIAFINGGGIRSTLPKGELKYGDIFEVSPFDNFPATVMLTGAQITEALRITTNAGRGALMPSGLRYSYDAAKPGDRLVSVTLANGQPLDPDKLYKVVVPDFLVTGGEGLGGLMKQVPAERKSVDMSQPLRELFVAALKKHKEPLVPKTDGRLTVLNAKGSAD
ncbi:MAG TPA: 5'-nucleotidase C-terminal domain-containing protein [Thermoanaerobaculia bacterium]|nr:5'-nucleotidase C-terminal domain-containing protein [Thermoanaerobaculia bacterium]